MARCRHRWYGIVDSRAVRNQVVVFVCSRCGKIRIDVHEYRNDRHPKIREYVDYKTIKEEG